VPCPGRVLMVVGAAVQRPDDARAATEVPRNSGHPPAGAVSSIEANSEQTPYFLPPPHTDYLNPGPAR